METSRTKPNEPRSVQVPISGQPPKEESKPLRGEEYGKPSKEGEYGKPSKEGEYGKPSKTEGEYGKGSKTECQECQLTKSLRPLGVTSIRAVEIINRQYISSGVNMYVKNREGNYQNLDVSNFLNHADLKLTFTLPLDASPDELAFCHQKSTCPIVNPLLHCQCTIRVGLLEPVGEMCRERELVFGRACKTYTVELPLIRTLALDPFNTRFYTLRIAGLKLPDQTEVFWRLHLKVCPAENIAEVISITDQPFDVNVVQENLNTIGDRLNDMVLKPLKRRGWFPWGRREPQFQGSTQAQQPPQGQKEPQYQQSVYSSV